MKPSPATNSPAHTHTHALPGLISYKTSSDKWGTAVYLSASTVLDIPEYAGPQGALRLLQDGTKGLRIWNQALEKAKNPKGAALLNIHSLEILAPLPEPPSMRDGYAFRQHVETARRNRGLEMIPEFDLFPVFYFTNHGAVSGPGPVDVQKLHLERLDFELEVGIVIGRGGRNIPVEKADEHIWGYTILNDWSARALQMDEMKLNLGPAKGKDFATSIGPTLVPRSLLLEAGYLKPSPKGEVFHGTMTASINDTEYSRGNVNQMNWTFAEILARASYGVDLRPGDIIGSGTVGTGCLLELNGSKITQNLWLKESDTITLTVDGLGTLKNTIRLSSDAYMRYDV